MTWVLALIFIVRKNFDFDVVERKEVITELTRKGRDYNA
tara:strand:- start:76 stop:192 length:117 start_codon:yes stop_codon:yes gene_type:complete